MPTFVLDVTDPLGKRRKATVVKPTLGEAVEVALGHGFEVHGVLDQRSNDEADDDGEAPQPEVDFKRERDRGIAIGCGIAGVVFMVFVGAPIVLLALGTINDRVRERGVDAAVLVLGTLVTILVVRVAMRMRR